MAEYGTLPTFQFTPEGATGARAGASGAAPSLGVSGGGIEVGAGVRHLDTTDIGAGSTLPAFLEQALAPKLEAVKQQKFWAGFTAARAGKSAAEIQEEQPWFAGIFGPTSYELGASTFQIQKAGADFETEITTRMPELRKLTPEQFGIELNKISTNLRTGDLYTDAQIQKTMIERAGPAMDMHFKARYTYQQEELARGQNQSWLSAGAAYHTAQQHEAAQGKEHPGQVPSPEQQIERKRTFLQTFQSPEGQNPESYFKNLVDTTDQMAEAGQWYALTALEESGVYNQLQPDDREKLRTRVEGARTRFKKNLANGPLMKPIAMLFASASAGAISAEDFVNGALEINQQYTALTGDTTEFFDQSDVVGGAKTAAGQAFAMWESMSRKTDAAREKAQTAAEKEAAATRNTEQWSQAANTNSLGTYLSMPNTKREDAEAAFTTAVQANSGNPERQAEIIIGNAFPGGDQKLTFTSQTLKDNLATTVIPRDEYNSDFARGYETWKALRYHKVKLPDGSMDTTTGLAASKLYFGADAAARMQTYDNDVNAGIPPEYAYRRSFSNQQDRTVRGATVQEGKDAAAALEEVVSTLNPSWYQMGKNSLTGSSQNFVLQTIAPYYQSLLDGGDTSRPDNLASHALKMARANGLEIHGRFAWQNIRGQKPLSSIAGMDPDTFTEHFEQSLTDRFRARGMTLDTKSDVMIWRIGDDKDGTPRLLAIADREGKRVTVPITGEDIKAVRNKKAEAERNYKPTVQRAGRE